MSFITVPVFLLLLCEWAKRSYRSTDALPHIPMRVKRFCTDGFWAIRSFWYLIGVNRSIRRTVEDSVNALCNACGSCASCIERAWSPPAPPNTWWQHLLRVGLDFKRR